MKKLIAISVVFALVAGAAFAVDVSAEIIGKTDIIKGDTGKDYGIDDQGKVTSDSHKVEAGGWPGGIRRLRLDGSGEDDNGTFGGWFRFENYGYAGNPSWYGNVWWKPVEQVRFRLGGNPDGDFSADGVARWGFYQIGGDTDVIHESWKFGASFYEGWGKNGGLLTITPTDEVAINLGIPYSDGGKAQDVYMKSTFQVAYTAEGLGKFALTYKSGLGNKAAVDATQFKKVEKKTYSGGTWGFDANGDKVYTGGTVTTTTTYEGINAEKPVHDPGQLWVFAGLTMIENLEIDVGLGYTLPQSGKGLYFRDPAMSDDDWDDFKDSPGYEGSINAPIAIGLGAHYNGGDFGVKTRLQLQLAGKVTWKETETVAEAGSYKIPMNIVFDVLPYYNISDSLAFLFSAGVDYTAKGEEKGVVEGKEVEIGYAKVGFHVEPYIAIKSSWWAPNLYAGIRIETDGVKHPETGKLDKDGSTVTKWSVPLGIIVAF